MAFSRIDFVEVKKYALKFFKMLCYFFAAICFLGGVIPLVFFGHLNPGNISLIIYGMLLLTLLLAKIHSITRPKLKKFLVISKRILVGFLAICFITGFVVSVFMIKYAFFNEPTDVSAGSGTVVVLGCKINGQQPSLTLAGRLDAACEFLKEHKDSIVVVSGGQGWDEEISEAYVMKKYLIEKGIEETRIFMEEKSVNTDENIKFSGEIIKENDLPRTMYIVTDTFHSYRGFLFAERNGYIAKNISSDIYWPLLAEYWVRDILGVLHMKFTPNWDLKIQNS